MTRPIKLPDTAPVFVNGDAELTPRQLAGYSQVHYREILALITTGKLRALRTGAHKWRILWSDYQAYRKSCETKPKGEIA